MRRHHVSKNHPPKMARRALLKGLVTGAAAATVLAPKWAAASGYFNLGGFWRRNQPSTYILQDTADVNLFDLAGRPTQPVDLVFEILPGVTVYSTSPTAPALDTGVFPAGSTIKLINRGQIIGAGGNGATEVLQGSVSAVVPPGAGGAAIGMRYPLTVDNSGGFILGGGGGGAVGARGGYFCLNGGGAGGGGAGRVGGRGGPATVWGGGAGSDGSTVGGEGGAGLDAAKQGGRGGEYGAPGNRGPAPDLAGCPHPDEVGAAGQAILTNGHALTFLGDAEDPYVKGPIA